MVIRFLLVIVLAFCSASLATDITLLGGYQFNTDFVNASVNSSNATAVTNTVDDDITLDNAATFDLALDYVFERQPYKRIGFYISHQQTEFDENSGLSNFDLDITHVHFTGTSYYPQGKLEPFVLGGLGFGRFSPGDSRLDNETQFSAQLGTGANYRFTDNFLLRTEVRWIATFFDGSGAVFCSGGCNIEISGSAYSQLQANLGLMYRF